MKNGRRGISGRGSNRKALRGLDGWGAASKWASGGRDQQKPDHIGFEAMVKNLNSPLPTKAISYSRHQSPRRLRTRSKVSFSRNQDQLNQEKVVIVIKNLYTL